MTTLKRRQFLTAAAGSLAVNSSLLCCHPQLRAAGSPSDRVTIGVIGLGSRGYNLIDGFLALADAQIIAICDVDRFHHRDRPWGTGTAFGREPAAKKINAAMAQRKSGTPQSGLGVYSDYRELIARDDLDAVVVATPDHWHALCTLDALRAGKDVYCEKPVTHLFGEGQQVYREVAKRGAVFQTGSQQRSDQRFRRAVELARNGLLGRISRVEVGLPPGYDGPQGDAAISDPPASLDYEFWCGPAPKLPYMRARHHRWWRGHRAFGGGVLMDWIGHHNDIAHWALAADDRGPTQVTARDWTFPDTDVYNTPHHYSIECEYEGGVTSTISSRNPQGLKLIGDEGWVFVRRGQMNASQPRWIDPQFDPGDKRVYHSDSHVRNFLDCVRTRRSCIAPAETAHRSITPGHLGYVSNALGRSLKWNPQTESVVDDDTANQLLNRMDYRTPWSA